MHIHEAAYVSHSVATPPLYRRYCRTAGHSANGLCFCSFCGDHPCQETGNDCLLLLYREESYFGVSMAGPAKNMNMNVGFEVFTAVTMKNGVFWVVTSCGSFKNRRFGGTWRLLHQGDKNR
jgi:hypothetical protein